jgi:hypothetical protein
MATMNRHKKRLNDLERKATPEEQLKVIVDWGEATGDPVLDAKLRAERPTHSEDGGRIIYIDWPEDDHKPLTRSADKD